MFQEHDDGGEEEEELVFRGETHADLLLAGLNQMRWGYLLNRVQMKLAGIQGRNPC